VVILIALSLASCVSLETAVPPVATLAVQGRNTETLEAGRNVYLDRCTHCHSPQPVGEYAVSRWPTIIAEMAERSKLSTEQHRALLAYVMAATQAR
jgi:mono/diheme cytochrome c family protein